MEKSKKRCTHCRRTFIPKRNPQQRYCGQKACKNARKQRWRQLKRRSDLDYRENQQRVNQAWQQNRRDYWRCYRGAHPDYVEKNRETTRLRKQKSKAVLFTR